MVDIPIRMTQITLKILSDYTQIGFECNLDVPEFSLYSLLLEYWTVRRGVLAVCWFSIGTGMYYFIFICGDGGIEHTVSLIEHCGFSEQ